MDQRLESIMKNYDKMKIGLDDKFKFHCTMCGMCCINRDDILLNAKDVFTISKYLGLKIPEFINEYCEVYVGDSSRFPIVRLNPRGYEKRCPLLEGKRCKVHEVKPTVCAMFPIGRSIRLDDKNIDTITAKDTQYLFVHPNCGDKRISYTVREWLEKFDIPIEDEFYIEWNKMLSNTSLEVHRIEAKLDKELMKKTWDLIFAIIYLAYDFNDDFLEQFKRNALQLKEVLKKIDFGGKGDGGTGK